MSHIWTEALDANTSSEDSMETDSPDVTTPDVPVLDLATADVDPAQDHTQDAYRTRRPKKCRRCTVKWAQEVGLCRMCQHLLERAGVLHRVDRRYDHVPRKVYTPPDRPTRVYRVRGVLVEFDIVFDGC